MHAYKRGRFKTYKGYSITLRRGEARASFVMDHGRVGPPGVLGGEAGQPNRIEIQQGGRTFVPVHLSKDQDIQLRRGDVINVQTPGGGGYGNPSDRSAKLMAKDVKHGYRAFPSAPKSADGSVAKLKAAE